MCIVDEEQIPAVFNGNVVAPNPHLAPSRTSESADHSLVCADVVQRRVVTDPAVVDQLRGELVARVGGQADLGGVVVGTGVHGVYAEDHALLSKYIILLRIGLYRQVHLWNIYRNTLLSYFFSQN